MCGIVGVASNNKISNATLDLFKSLLLHDVVRGHHATGVAAINTAKNEVGVTKEAIPSYEFLEKYEIVDDCNIYIGHNRWATRGSKDSDDNAHPFQHGTITGVHNGSLRDQSLLDNHKDFEVDSDNLYNHLSIHGTDATMTKIDGAFALVWYDSADKTLNFIRNSERPLFLAQLNNGSVAWASEELMLEWLIGRTKTLSIATKDNKRRIYPLEVGVHFKISFSGFVMQKPHAVKKELHKRTWPVYGGYGTHGTQTWEEQHLQKVKKINSAATQGIFFELAYQGTLVAGTGTMYLFEYVHPDGRKYTMYTHTDLSKLNLSFNDKVFGRVTSIFDSNMHTNARIVNTPNTCIVVGDVTVVRPSSFLATGRISRPQVVVTLQLANDKISSQKLAEIREENKDLCANCGNSLRNIFPGTLWLHDHYDLEEATTHNYLSCSKVCNDSMKEFTKELDQDYLKQFAMLNV